MKFSFDGIYEEMRRQYSGFSGKLNQRLNIIEKEVARRVKDGEKPNQAVDVVMKKERFVEGLTEDTKESMANMAASGYNVKPMGNTKTKPLSQEQRKTIGDKLARKPWTADQINLSERLYGTGKKVRQDIVDTIAGSMRNTDTVRQMAKKLYDGYNSGRGVLPYAQLPAYMQKMRNLALLAAHGDKLVIKDLDKAIKIAEMNIGNLSAISNKEMKAAYNSLLKACKSKTLKENMIERAVYVAVQEKTRYHAMRIARTENQRAWFNGLIAKYKEDPLVFGFRWQLSSRHKTLPYDICDVCANIDVGFGKGVYYKNKIPVIPLHPHCMCMALPVFITEIKPGSIYRPKRASEYMNSLDEAKKQALFSKQGADSYKKDGNWQKHLRGWEGLKDPHSVLRAEDFQATKDNASKGGSEQPEAFDIKAQVSYLKKQLAQSDSAQSHIETLQYYADETEFQVGEGGAPYRYKTDADVITYNPKHPEFFAYKPEQALLHELTHRADVLYYESFKNQGFLTAIQKSERIIEEKFDLVQEIMSADQKYKNNMALCDILSALSGAKLELTYGHTPEYWRSRKEMKPLEIFANLSVAELMDDNAKLFVQLLLPELYEAYRKTIGRDE